MFTSPIDIEEHAMFNSIHVKIKKLYDNTVLPYYATKDSAGMDCTVNSVEYDSNKECWVYRLGFALEIPKGYVGLLFPRSSVYKTGLIQSNCVGVIDSDYRGEVSVRFYIANFANRTNAVYNIGERCCQLIILPYPKIELIESNTLTSTERGSGGYGSTGL